MKIQPIFSRIINSINTKKQPTQPELQPLQQDTFELEKPQNQNVSFGYKHPLKDLFKKGQLPFVKKGCYGEPINNKNVTLEHFECASTFPKGKKRHATVWDNLGLASADKNMERGNQPLSTFINWKAFGEYLDQFRGQYIPGFGPGEKYIKGIVARVNKLVQRGD